MNSKKFKVKEKKWLLKSIVTEEASSRVVEIAKELGINPIIAKLL